jgi:hypothetical protein
MILFWILAELLAFLMAIVFSGSLWSKHVGPYDKTFTVILVAEVIAISVVMLLAASMVGI